MEQGRESAAQLTSLAPQAPPGQLTLQVWDGVQSFSSSSRPGQGAWLLLQTSLGAEEQVLPLSLPVLTSHVCPSRDWVPKLLGKVVWKGWACSAVLAKLWHPGLPAPGLIL